MGNSGIKTQSIELVTKWKIHINSHQVKIQYKTYNLEWKDLSYEQTQATLQEIKEFMNESFIKYDKTITMLHNTNDNGEDDQPLSKKSRM